MYPYMFDTKGQIIVDKEECRRGCGRTHDDRSGCRRRGLLSEEEDSFEISDRSPDRFQCSASRRLEKAGIPMAAAEVTMIPQTLCRT